MSRETFTVESIAHYLRVDPGKFLDDDMVQRAFRLASKAHAGQADKLGEPYIYHPFSVAAQLDTPNEIMAALLHDVVEDTDTTFKDLNDFPPEVVAALRLLTRADGVPYEDYLQGIRSNPLALRVKLADLAHNSDPGRLARLEQQGEEGRKTAARLKEKYTHAYQILKAGQDNE